jgi:hypothetical protein
VIDFPPEAKANWLKGTIKAGSVYKFSEATFSSTDPHFFIVLNHTPSADPFIALVVASSQIAKVQGRNSHLPPETLIRINPGQYADFTLPSIVDGNQVHQRSIGELEFKIKTGKLEIKADMDLSLVKRIRIAVNLSKKVEDEVKDLFLVC